MNEIEEFSCGYCHEIFKSQSNLLEHVEEIHSDQEQSPSRTDGDSEEIETKAKHFDVVFTATNESPIDIFECHPCHILFESETNLAKHIQNHHSESENTTDDSSEIAKWTCSICHKNFKFQQR